MKSKKNPFLFILILMMTLTALCGAVQSETAFANDSFKYTVSEGDCLWLVANKFGVTVDALKSANNLSSDFLHIGQSLIIPGSANPSPAPAVQAGTPSEYTVVHGDCLWTIAIKFGTSIEAIKSVNSLSSDTLAGPNQDSRCKLPAGQQGSCFQACTSDRIFSKRRTG